MIIDFHTHIFPEKIAAKALKKLSDIIHLTPSINGCESGLLSSMEEAGIDISVVLPVVTTPEQFSSILHFAVRLNETYAERKDHRLISLGGIHIASEHMEEELKILKQEGFSGIKIHPNYQGVDFSDLRCKRLLYKASELDLAVLTHAGYDPVTPDHEYCSPDMILEVINDVAPKKLILAHLGSNENYAEAEEKLCGHNVYLDTAYSISQVSDETLTRMVRKHGADHVLFATDVPWSHQKTCVDILKNSSLSDTEKEMIFSGNAKQLLQL